MPQADSNEIGESQDIDAKSDDSPRPIHASEYAIDDDPPRLVLRNLPFDQSRNIVQVEHNQGTAKISRLIRHDLFHVLLQLSTLKIIFLLISCWTALLLFFAAMYIAADRHHGVGVCSMGLPGEPLYYYTAFAHSLQTAVSTGYAMPNGSNAYFEDCPALIAATYFQLAVSLFFNAFLIGVIIARISNHANRAVQVVYSKKAIVSMVAGQVRFQFRVYDVDSRHPVVEAQVRIFGVAKDRPVPRQLRTLQPNDELGGALFLSLPQVISHHIDIYSMLHPLMVPSLTEDGAVPLFSHNNQGFVLRQADSATCGRKEVICPVCGVPHANHEQWARHVRFMQASEQQEGYPTGGTHLAIPKHELDVDRYRPMTDLQVLRSHFLDNINEVICVVEGIDPLTSGNFTALYSYQAADIVWDDGATFSPCLRAADNYFQVDLDRFHEIVTKPTTGSKRLPQLSLRPQDAFFREEPLGKPMDVPQAIEEGNEEEEVAVTPEKE